MCVGSVCTQPPYNDNNPPSIFNKYFTSHFFLRLSVNFLTPPPPLISNTFSYTIKGPCVFSIWPILTFINNAKHRHLESLLVIPMEKNHFLPSSCISHLIRITCSPPWELELRPLEVATGNALSVTRVWRYICKNTTCWPATAHDVTTGVPQYKCRRENTSSAFSSSLTGLFEACNLVRVQFSLYQMASTSKAFKIVCGSASSLLTPDDTHNLCVFCLGKEHARDVLEGKSACTVSFFYVKAPLSSCPSFRGKRGSRLLPAILDPPLPRHGGEWN